MDYEKKYNEALERARKVHRNYKNLFPEDSYSEDIEEIFPELRESEDERIRKAIIELLKEVGRDDTGISENAKCMIAYLEKQKINTEGDFGRGYDCGYEACLNSHGAEWFDKQKEQKPNIELIQRSWYMEGYHDGEFGQEPKWILKTGEGGPKHELNPRYGQPLAEQRPTEEQLHNLNEAIKGLRMDGCERIADSLHSLYNILKLNKEQKPELVQQPPITYTYNSNASRDERLKAALLALLNSDLLKVKEGGYFTKQDLIEWVERMPTDKPAWSEEDEDMLNSCISSIEEAKENRYAYKETDGDTSYDHEIAWLKSLRSCPSWKPSEEQMEALQRAIDACESEWAYQDDELRSLLNDLKKL